MDHLMGQSQQSKRSRLLLVEAGSESDKTDTSQNGRHTSDAGRRWCASSSSLLLLHEASMRLLFRLLAAIGGEAGCPVALLHLLLIFLPLAFCFM